MTYISLVTSYFYCPFSVSLKPAHLICSLRWAFCPSAIVFESACEDKKKRKRGEKGNQPWPTLLWYLGNFTLIPTGKGMVTICYVREIKDECIFNICWRGCSPVWGLQWQCSLLDPPHQQLASHHPLVPRPLLCHHTYLINTLFKP